MRFLHPVAVSLAIGLAVLVSSSGGRAQAPLVAAFHGIGDLGTGTPAAIGSAVRDATRVNGVLYAVGSTAAGNAIVCTSPGVPTGCQTPPIYNLDTPVLWTSSGGPAGTLTALPPGPAFPNQSLPGAPGTPATAYAITPGAEFIASQAHYSTDITSGGTNWVRVTTSGLPTSAANTNLSSFGGGFAALAISGDGPGPVVDGNVIYGQVTSGSQRLAVRYDLGGAYAQVPVPTGLGYSNAWTLPVPRGTSQDGTVMIGVASPGPINGSGGLPLATFVDAFHYVQGSGSTLIPKLTGGTWNFPLAISSDGNITLLAGNSSNFPNGEVYLSNNLTSAVTSLGSPNTAWTPRILGGMTADGVVAVTFANNPLGGPGAIAGLGLPTGSKYGYLHNINGWFHLANALAAQNIDLASQGWDPTNIAITGVRTVDGMDLVFGQGRRRTAVGGVFVDGAMEGFVAEFPAGYLAGYAHPTPAPPGNGSIIGAWTLGANFAYFFMADGTYYEVSTGGFERGFYAYGADDSYRIWTRQDTDGGAISGFNGKLDRTVTIVGDTLTIADANCPGCAQTTMTRVVPSTGTLIGGWVLGDPTTDDSSAVGMFTGTPTGGKYFFAQDFEEQDDQSEVGTWSWDGTTLALSAITGNRNGAQFSISNNSQPAQLSVDDLGLLISDQGFSFSLKRIVDPATVLPAITNATFEASGTEDGAFSFTVTAVNALTYSATGLPAGVTINADTGVISGTPVVNGTFNAQVTVTNTLGSTTTRTLVLTVAAPAASMRGIGDLTGGNVASGVRDATRVNGVIYAVGGSTVNATGATNFDLDTPALWTYTGTGSGTLAALPYGSGVTNTNTTARTAYAISSLDGQYIASQAQFTNSGTGTRWVRVDRNLVPNTTANLDISNVAGVPVAFAALSISESGDVLYGQGTNADGTRTPRRYQSGNIQTVDISATGKTWGFPTPRGTTTDGSVMVGAASTGAFTGTSTPIPPFGYGVQSTNSVAFRYAYNAVTQTGTTSVIPFAAGGTWNFPIAISGDGGETVVAGNSTEYPNGEIYLTNAANSVTARLGSPNTGLTPRLLGGRTDDGAIVVTFVTSAQEGLGQIAGLQLPSTQRIVYLHNGNGWFLLGSVLRQQGLDLEALGWNATLMTVTGVHTVEGVDLIFGQGVRRTLNPATGLFTDGAPEGFVIELPAGTLANFNPTVTSPVDDALVGGWIVGNQANPSGVTVYLGDGRYVSLTQGASAYQNGSERGSYAWPTNGGDFYVTARVDHNAQFGLQAFSVLQGRTMTVTGDSQSLYNTHCNPGVTACAITSTRIVGDASSVVGAWRATVPSGPAAGAIITAAFLGQAQGYRYLVDYDVPGGDDDDDFELGTYTFTQGTLTTTRDGGGGVAEPGGAVLSRDGLQMVVEFDDDLFVTFTRVVRPATVVPVITSPLTASGTLTQPFSYTVTATYGQTFGATGLPAGLSIDANTGVISGTPATGGHVVATISATNSFGATGTALLDLMIENTGAGDDVTVTTPGSPLTLTFDTVVAPGLTEVTNANPATAPQPPAGMTGPTPSLYFLATSTATYSGPVTACVTTSGSNLQGGIPTLYYHDGTSWVSTLSAVRTNGQVCGTAPGLGYLVVMSDSRLMRIGDLNGGSTGSLVRDATMVGGTILAVGSSVSRNQNTCTTLGVANVPPGCLVFPNLDSPVVWDSATNTLSALPAGPGVDFNTQATNQIFAFAITPDGQSIAAQSHYNTTGATGTNAVRVDRTGGTWTNVSLSDPAVAVTSPNPANVAYALSDNHNIVYAQQNNTRAVRLDVSGTQDVVPIPLPSGVTTTQSFPIGKGTSSDGNVMVGIASNGAFNFTNGVAFRYVYGAGPVGTTTRIPNLTGGTWNYPIALTPDGRYTLLAGNSGRFFQTGEIYVHDATTGATTVLGSPNAFLSPKVLGGITADGQAVAVTFSEQAGALPNNRHAYVHNSFGWWPFTSVLTAQGIDLVAAGFDPANLVVAGIRSVNTDADPEAEYELVFGQGRRRTLNAAGTGYDLGAQEGFVVTLTAGTLASFNVPVSNPADVGAAIVGAWAVGDALTPSNVFVFNANGTFFRINRITSTNPVSVGFERGRFTWAGNGTALLTVPMFDTDGTTGSSGSVGRGFTMSIDGDVATFGDPHCPSCTLAPVYRISDGLPRSLVAGWALGDAAAEDSSALVLLANGTYFWAMDTVDEDDAEIGTYTSAPDVLTFTRTVGAGGGLGDSTVNYRLSADDLELTILPSPDDGGGEFPALRVVHPLTVLPVITSAASASGEATSPFSYQITAVHAATYDATGLPSGLTVDLATGEISGNPAVSGTFNATLFATNSFGNASTAPLEITIANGVTPVAQNGTVGTSEETAVSGTLVATDPNGDQLTYTLNSNGALGSAVITDPLTGAFTYTPNPNANGSDSISFTASDGVLTSNVAAVTIAITPVNDVPVVGNAAIATTEDTPVAGTLGVTDPDNQPLTFSIVANGSIGTAALTNPATGAFTYTPNPNASGTDAFTFKVNDGFADSNIGTVTVTVAAAADAPLAADASLSVTEDVPAAGTLIATDAEGQPLTFSLLTSGTRGTAVLTNASTGAFTYTPNPNATGPDSFTFTANDGVLASNVATVTVSIAAVNDLPVTTGGNLTTTEDTPASGTLSASDADNEPLTFSIVANGTRGSATITNAAGGTFTYTPHPNASGTDTFTFKVNDGVVDSNISTVTVTIASVDDQPVASSASVTTTEDNSFSGVLVATDAESASLTYSLVSNGTLGTVVLNDATTGAFTYSPNRNASGIDSFTFRANDGAVDSNLATVTVTITPVSDAPVAVNGTVITNEDAAAAGSLSATDPDSSSLTYSLMSNGTLGTAAINVSTGAFTYTPNPNVSGSDAFSFRVNDGSSNSNVATVSVTITAVNDSPVATSASRITTEDTAIAGTLLASDPDNPVLTFSIVANGTLGTATVTNPATGAYSYTPNANAFGTDSFTFRASDGNVDSNVATVTVTITPVNDTPLAAAGVLTTNEDLPVSGSFVATDPDTATLTYSIVQNGSRGTATLTNATTGAFTYVPNPNANGADIVTFRAFDGATFSSPAQVTVTIVPVNDAPVATGGSVTTTEDVPVSGGVSATDVDGQPLAFAVVSNGAKGTATFTNPATGAFTYTPNPNATGSDSFTVKAGDGVLDSNIVMVSVTITAVNDAPIASNGTLTINEDTSGSGVVSASDVDSAVLNYSLVSNGTRGTATITGATGAFTYVPNANANGTDSFTFRVSDGVLFSANATVSVTINPVNDLPVVTGTVLTTQGAPVSGGVTVSDVDSDALTVSVVTPAAQGNVVVTDAATGALTYTPNAGASGYDPVVVQVSDGQGGTNQASVLLFNVTPTSAWPGQMVRASVSSAGVQANGDSYYQSISADGRFIAFTSGAYNLVANGRSGVYVRDRETQQTTAVSVALDGTPASAYQSSISADGRFVAFVSGATNLVPGDTNTGLQKVYVRDRQAGQTMLVTVASDGAPANGHSYDPAISADGRFVAFRSSASNLVAGDTNNVQDIFVRALQTGVTTRVSISTSGVQGNNQSELPAISADGRFVVFSSHASNLVPNDSNSTWDTFVHDRRTGQTTRVSVSSAGIQAINNSSSGWGPAISADGRYVAFESSANNLVDADTNNTYDVFVHDRQTAQTTRVSVGAGGAQATSPSYAPSLSADGRFVAFQSSATNLDPADTTSAADVYVHDRQTGTTRLVSVSNLGVAQPFFLYTYCSSGYYYYTCYDVYQYPNSYEPTISADGRFVAFWSDNWKLVPNDTGNYGDVFVVGNATVTPSTASFTAAGGNGSLNVSSTYPGGYWTATRSGSFITLNTTSGTGNGTVAYTVAPNTTGQSRTGTITVAFQIVTIQQAGNTAPVAQSGSLTTDEDTPAAGTLVATDANGDALTFSIVSNGTKGTAIVTNAATGAFTYTPNVDASGTDSFTFRASDGTVASNVATITVTINAVNDAPVASAGTLTTGEDTPAGGTLVATDVDSAALTYSVVANGTKGTAVIIDSATGAFTYTPNADADGSDSVTFKASDGSVDSNTATLLVTITPVNDTPVANSESFTTDEDTPFSGSLVATDVDNPTVTYSLLSSGTIGTAVMTDATTGAFTYTPNPNVYGVDSFTFTVTDGTATSNTATITVTVNAVIDPQTPVIVQVPASTAVFGSSFTATITGGSGMGTLSFAAIGSCSNVSGGAQVTMTSGTGPCTITATKDGDVDFAPFTSDPVVVTAATAASATALASSLNPATYGQSVTLTATITSGVGVPTGSVTFNDGATALGTSSLNASGVATLTVSLAAGAHNLTAAYGGSANHTASLSSSLSETIGTATTATSLTSSVNPAGPNQQITFTATVTGQYGGAVTGTVTFYRGNTAIGTTAVVSGTAGLTTTLGTGSHAITAAYRGDSNSIASTSIALTQVVLAPSISTTTTVTSSLNPSIAGQMVTFAATVSESSPGTPTGTVTFRVGQTVLGTVALTGNTATYSTNSLAAGNNGITAVYNGDNQFLSSTSVSLNQVVNLATTSITATSSPNPATASQAITVNVTVTSANGVIPAGTVTVAKSGNPPYLTLTLDATGRATGTIAAGVLPKTNNSLKVAYAGDADHAASNTTITQKVQ